MIGKWYSIDALLKEVLKDRKFFCKSNGGVTLSGGEPLMQHQFVYNFIEACHQIGVYVTINTSGYTSTSVIEGLLKHVDYWLFDLKVVDDEKHFKKFKSN